jgi:hypothetical protein
VSGIGRAIIFPYNPHAHFILFFSCHPGNKVTKSVQKQVKTLVNRKNFSDTLFDCGILNPQPILRKVKSMWLMNQLINFLFLTTLLSAFPLNAEYTTDSSK